MIRRPRRHLWLVLWSLFALSNARADIIQIDFEIEFTSGDLSDTTSPFANGWVRYDDAMVIESGFSVLLPNAGLDSLRIIYADEIFDETNDGGYAAFGPQLFFQDGQFIELDYALQGSASTEFATLDFGSATYSLDDASRTGGSFTVSYDDPRAAGTMETIHNVPLPNLAMALMLTMVATIGVWLSKSFVTN